MSSRERVRHGGADRRRRPLDLRGEAGERLLGAGAQRRPREAPGVGRGRGPPPPAGAATRTRARRRGPPRSGRTSAGQARRRRSGAATSRWLARSSSKVTAIGIGRPRRRASIAPVELRRGHQLVRASQVTQMPLERRRGDPGHDLLSRRRRAERLVVDERTRDAGRRRPQPPAEDRRPQPPPRRTETAPQRPATPIARRLRGEPRDLGGQAGGAPASRRSPAPRGGAPLRRAVSARPASRRRRATAAASAAGSSGATSRPLTSSVTTSGMLPMRAATTGVLSAIASMRTSGVTSPAGSSSASAASRRAATSEVGPAKWTCRATPRSRA